MARASITDSLFRPAAVKPKTKNDITDNAAREILKAETDARESKSAKLREARLAMEAERPPVVEAVRKPAVRKRVIKVK